MFTVFICGYNPSVSIADNVARVQERIAAAAARAGRRVEEITLVAVSKTFPAERIREAYDAGVRHFGENRVQEWEGKAAALADLHGAVWHLVGHLQSNKARRAVELFSAIDSVDSVALGQRLDRLMQKRFTAEDAKDAEGWDVGAGLQSGVRTPVESTGLQKPETAPLSATSHVARLFRGGAVLPILLEVRLAPEEAKHGVEPNELAGVAEAVLALPHLELRGLMCIPPYREDPEEARPYFRRLRQLRDSLAGAQTAARLRELSMGMSHDFAVAIEEGATQVRIGTAIFGERR